MGNSSRRFRFSSVSVRTNGRIRMTEINNNNPKGSVADWRSAASAQLILLERIIICWAMSLSKSVPLDAATRSPMNQHVPASKLFYPRLISVISALLLKPKHQSPRIASHVNLTRSSTTWSENMEYRSCQTWIAMISFSIIHTVFCRRSRKKFWQEDYVSVCRLKRLIHMKLSVRLNFFSEILQDLGLLWAVKTRTG